APAVNADAALRLNCSGKADRGEVVYDPQKGWSAARMWTDHDWYENGDYDGTDCSHCGRERVMVCDAPDGSKRRVCEKCGWDQAAEDYACTVEFQSDSTI